jgi:hypothetical protein
MTTLGNSALAFFAAELPRSAAAAALSDSELPRNQHRGRRLL